MSSLKTLALLALIVATSVFAAEIAQASEIEGPLPRARDDGRPHHVIKRIYIPRRSKLRKIKVVADTPKVQPVQPPGVHITVEAHVKRD
ncbi:hypothetical protein CC1G_06588 [Coprinopsis cinerea okayama7|uniref:Uncharacterized protein n=1 Tax=Coprinopsis cinerea (strain Okayama-7 / 130 / ATCC MYA-4618 / FGSC 9003) TaxID=240176 RepID=A8N316_COPC7|nr:hypothetical protein CC1G_06588 [Coprinopsis cinerea okayama7\|eukprot:XP_001829251.2 hypothetical protein CC1G_06588 [Coprinopsis cinerea okayama7\